MLPFSLALMLLAATSWIYRFPLSFRDMEYLLVDRETMISQPEEERAAWITSLWRFFDRREIAWEGRARVSCIVSAS